MNKDDIILIEAESFLDKGGWVIDQQFMDQMGSSYLLAHGLGKPVKDAKTLLTLKEDGTFYVWVRTKEWSKCKNKKQAPGIFQLECNHCVLPTFFGNKSTKWSWQYGGIIKLHVGENQIVLKDKSGFDGRCDAIVFAKNKDLMLPNSLSKLNLFRKENSKCNISVSFNRNYELIVVGGGIAGICTAIAASRLGIKVGLIHDRPLIGGNNSSDVRVQLGGIINQPPFENIGNIVNEIDPHFKQNARQSYHYKDSLKMEILQSEKNIDLLLNYRVIKVHKKNSKISSVILKSIDDDLEIECEASFFVDCTGDGNLGYLAGAKYMYGRESYSETKENLAPQKNDMLTLGTSVMWYSLIKKGKNSSFPDTPWAVQFDEHTYQKVIRGDWNWELGLGKDQIKESESIRDYGLKVIFGNWSYLKNRSSIKNSYIDRELSWVGYIAGKRESRRLIGDVIVSQNDIEGSVKWNDGCVITTWPIDLHYPIKPIEPVKESFLTIARKKKIKPYLIPYRCLYSKNCSNLFMAGRDISVTHVALGTVRVMRTGGLMGEVVGIASSICINRNLTPRELYNKHLDILIAKLKEGVPKKK